jgi:hypothetical protein
MKTDAHKNALKQYAKILSFFIKKLRLEFVHAHRRPQERPAWRAVW